MIKIDNTDKLYKYLSALTDENVDELYLELATLGRYTRNDIIKYFGEMFMPSSTNDVDESELEKVLDYYVDLKKIKPISKQALNQVLKEYKSNPSKEKMQEIIHSQLKDVLLMCLNYKSTHNDIDLQDLVQVANLGIITALETYKPDAKLDFKDYIIFNVRKNIIAEFKENK